MKIARIFFIALLLSVFSCENSDTEPRSNLAELIASEHYKQSAMVPASKALDSLNKYLSLLPELKELLTGEDKQTLFAPTNEAFATLYDKYEFTYGLTEGFFGFAIPILLEYHFAPGEFRKKDLLSGHSLNSHFFDSFEKKLQLIEINEDGSVKGEYQPIEIVSPDNIATNGVVHVINSVMIAPSLRQQLSERPAKITLAAAILLDKKYSNLLRVIESADALVKDNVDYQNFKILTWLAMPQFIFMQSSPIPDGITFFCP